VVARVASTLVIPGTSLRWEKACRDISHMRRAESLSRLVMVNTTAETVTQTTNHENSVKENEPGDVRQNRKAGGLPCGARFCHRCHEECGVIVYAYIMRDLHSEPDGPSGD